MKKQSLLLRACIVLSLLTTFCIAGQSQTQKTRVVNPGASEEKEWNSVEKEENALDNLSAADKAEGKEIGQMTVAYLFKALLHKTDPATYPIDESAGSAEKAALDALNRNFSATSFAKAKPKLTTLLADPAQRDKILGKYKGIDFKKKSITPEVQKIYRFKMRPTLRATDEGTAFEQPIITPFVGVGGAMSETAAPTKLDVLIKRVRCDDETNPESPGDDDIVVGGLLVGASGNTKAANTLVSCHFDDGDVCNHGVYPFGTYSMQTTPSYPKTVYCVFQLMEVDTDEASAAAMLSDVMRSVAAAVVGFNAAIGAVVAAVAEAVDRFGGWFFDDDAFPPYGVVRHISGPNAFGSDGVCPDKVTDYIRGHDGSYRIRYFWILR